MRSDSHVTIISLLSRISSRDYARVGCVVAVAMLILGPISPAGASSVYAVNAARSQLCAGTAQRTPLVEVPALDDAATHLSRGESLDRALVAASYRASEATAIPVGGASSDQALMATLAKRYCNEVARPEATEIGVSQRGGTLWLVVATPMQIPRAEDSSNIREHLLALVNEARSTPRSCGSRHYAAAPPVALSDDLSDAALSHAQSMARTGTFDHVDDAGHSPADRVRQTHYRARLVGENIAAGMGTAEEALEGWLASPGHCENLMEARFTHVGAAFATNLERDPAVCWTLDLAQAR